MANEEKKVENNEKKPKRRGYSISVKRVKITGIMFVVIFVVILFLMSPVFNVRKIEITGNSSLDDKVIIAASKISKGDNIFSIDVDKAIEGICTQDRINSATVTRKLPSKVVIDVLEETECAYIKLKNEYVGIDPNCRVLVISPQMTTEAPLVSGIKVKNASTGQFLRIETDQGKKKGELISKILTEAKNQDIIKNIKSIDVSEVKDIKLTLTSEILVNLGEDGKEADNRIEYKIAYLKAIIPRLGTQQGGVIELADTDNVTSRAS